MDIVRIKVLVIEVGEQDAVDQAYGSQFPEPHHRCERDGESLVPLNDGRVGGIVLYGMHDAVELGNALRIFVAADKPRYEVEQLVLIILAYHGVHRIVDERHDAEVITPFACQFNEHVEVAVP